MSARTRAGLLLHLQTRKTASHFNAPARPPARQTFTVVSTYFLFFFFHLNFTHSKLQGNKAKVQLFSVCTATNALQLRLQRQNYDF